MRLAQVLTLVALVSFTDGSGSSPKFKHQLLHNVVVHVDESYEFLCKVRGNPNPFLLWFHKNEMLSQSEKIKIGKYSLQINNLQKSDGGEYACRASNIHGEIWGNFTLQVVEDQVNVPNVYDHSDDNPPEEYDDLKGPPVFKKRLNQVRFLARAATTSVEFDCDVMAFPTPKINWWKNGIPIKEIGGKYIFDGYKLIVKSLTPEDKGNYTCVVRNEFGSVNWTTKLEVRQRVAIAPIMEDIKNQTALIGTNVTFTCQIVMSDSQPLLQWLRHLKKNDSDVNEKGEPYVEIIQSSRFKKSIDEPQHLFLLNVTKEDQGWYTCLVANTVGMNYRSVWLTVLNDDKGSPPKFQHQPIHDVVALVDESRRFLCKVRGNPEPFLLWFHKNEMLSQSKNIKIGKHSLKINNLKKSDSGEYSCKASNIHGEVWGNFTLQVVENKEDQVNVPNVYDHSDDNPPEEYDDLKGPPVFKKRLNQVQFLARAVTSSVEFECDVMAFPIAKIYWWKNGIPMKKKVGKYIFDGYNLIVKSLTPEDKGNYTCVVQNEFGSVNWTTKLEVQQRVAIAPIMEDIKNQTALIGANVTFTCQIVMSDSQPLLQWLQHFKRNDSYVNEKGEPYVKILQSSGFKSKIDDPQHLFLRNITKEDQGWYTCLVANTVGMNYRSAWLTVLNDDTGSPPKFKQLPIPDAVALVKESHKFLCKVRGNPKPILVWFHKNKLLSQSKKIKIGKYSLKIKKLKKSDSGEYACRASNIHGEIWANFTLKVVKSNDERIPIGPIMDDIKNQTALIGTNVTFTCQIVMSDSQPLLQWLRNFKKSDSFVNERGEHYIKILQSSGFKSTVDDPHHLVLRNVTKKDQGWYTCLVANTVGMDYRSAWLTVLNETEFRESKKDC